MAVKRRARDLPAPEQSLPPVLGKSVLRRPSRHSLRQLVHFGLNGLTTAGVYSGVVWSLIALSPNTFTLDVVVAYAVAVVANYFGARLVFQPQTSFRGHVLRYLFVVACTFVVTAAIAWLLHGAGAPNVAGAYLPVILTALPTFVVMRRWVFRTEAQNLVGPPGKAGSPTPRPPQGER